MKRILITGFEPFDGAKINPSYEAVNALPETIDGAQIIKMQIPTVFYKGAALIRDAIMKNLPDIIICVGQAGGRSAISIEQVAINIVEARIPDNEGNQPQDENVIVTGDNAYFSNLPVKAMVKAIQDKEIQVEISYSAGTFVCNEVMYQLLHTITKEFPSMRGGFIHVPYAPEQTKDKPSMPIETMTEALYTAIQAALTHQEDITLNTGTIH
ncbi:pyroglutamyl-peptidase I [Macrococcus armenti]|uniref:Pyroglutamyl-peptidase I n=1 Tax=Macrococcus armenti TaxID=2875764 RepID=A0ABY3ZVK9_9STAP|nr:pyroglutamyl-peptidase I [Macrococcus armenti]UOB20935.1 pyroglutamyl-peptidase I [Macrococcus armenti]